MSTHPESQNTKPDVEAQRQAILDRAISVSQALGVASAKVKEAGRMIVLGELSEWFVAGSGHAYFKIKDDKSSMSCVMWRDDVRKLPVHPEVGMQIAIAGQFGVFAGRGDLQMYVARLTTTDAGGLWRVALEKLRKQLMAEGLFDESRKRPLPRWSYTVGVATSAGGAVIHDICNVIAARSPWIRVVLSPCRVQGEGAADSIALAIERLDRWGECDVIIAGRGGGSIEDLWAFNEERTVRAVAACQAPIVVACGHDVDRTLSDLAADVSAPTPTAAAQAVSQDVRALSASLDRAPRALAEALRGHLRQSAERADRIEAEMERGMRSAIERIRTQISRYAEGLNALSPLAVLGRGYAVAAKDGHAIRDASALSVGDTVQVRLSRGAFDAEVTHVHEEEDDATED
jgi:exodeoxyribonuclease VII large subunit